MTNYWIAGAGKCAMSALVDQIATSTCSTVYGNSKQYPYTHLPNTVVHANDIPVPHIPTEQYTCVLVIRRDCVIQIMERWVEKGWSYLPLKEAADKLQSLITNTQQRIQELDRYTWRKRYVIHTEDFLNRPQHELARLGLEQHKDLAPSHSGVRPWQYISNYKELRQHLALVHHDNFKQINYLLQQFIDK